MPRMQCPRKLLPLIQIPKRFKIVIGGRGSAKSQTTADICLMDSQTKGLKIGEFREFQNSIEDSVYSLLCDEIERLELQGFTVQNNTILNTSGGEFRFKGLARNVESIKSMHGFDRFLVEEAQTISYKSLKLLTPTLRKEGSEIWMIANPMSRADPFSQRFIAPYEKELLKDGYYEDDLHLIIVCNYLDNPFFPAVLEQERIHDKEHLSTAEYEHIWLGKFNDTVENSIIPTDWFDAAIDAHTKLGFKATGQRVVSHDPSDLGADSKGLVDRHGSVIINVMEKETGDVNEGCDWATDYAINHHADVFTWDCDGLGVTLRRQVSDAFSGKQIKFEMFKGSEAADNPNEIYQPDESITQTSARTNRQTFKNKRAQYYWKLRDRFYNTYRAVVKGEYIDPDTMISLSSDIDCLDQLRAEVCRIPKKPNGNGLIQIMSKDDMLRIHKIPSPNLADSLMMSLINVTVYSNISDIDYDSEF